MMSSVAHGKAFAFKSQNLIIDPLRAFFWVEQEALLVSDVHLGKAGHFRKNGVPIPKQVHFSDFQRLDLLIERYEPKKIVFLGDLFHSDINSEWNDFTCWSEKHRMIDQLLVLGNHDILGGTVYSQTAVTVVKDWIVPPFHFTHETTKSEWYNISGHIHPGVRLRGKGRQSMILPCFYFSEKSALVPAFGNFTGSYVINPSKSDRIFAIADNSIIDLIG